MEDTKVIYGLFAGLTAVIVIGLLAARYFGAEISAWVADLDKPSAKALQRHSDEMLEQMHRNVYARKKRRTENEKREVQDSYSQET